MSCFVLSVDIVMIVTVVHLLTGRVRSITRIIRQTMPYSVIVVCKASST